MRKVFLVFQEVRATGVPPVHLVDLEFKGHLDHVDQKDFRDSQEYQVSRALVEWQDHQACPGYLDDQV